MCVKFVDAVLLKSALNYVMDYNKKFSIFGELANFVDANNYYYLC